MDRCKKYSIEEITRLVRQIKNIYYPPSGKCYNFADGSDCENWNLEVVIEEKISELEDELEYWYIDLAHPLEDNGTVVFSTKDFGLAEDNARKRNGNYFKTKEEAEIALRKLQAWKRLNDRWIKFYGWNGDTGTIRFDVQGLEGWAGNRDVIKDLDLLFGGRE